MLPMVKELDITQLEHMEQEAGDPDKFSMQKAFIKYAPELGYGTYHVFELEDSEMARLKLIESNLGKPNSFGLQARYLSHITGIPTNTIDSFGIQAGSNVLHITPKLPHEPHSDPAKTHAIEKGYIQP